MLARGARRTADYSVKERGLAGAGAGARLEQAISYIATGVHSALSEDRKALCVGGT